MQEQPKTINTTTARAKTLAGAKKVYDAVSSTLGPRSKNVAIRRPFGAPAVVHDGKTVARACLPLADPEEDTGAEIIFGAADKTDNIGDGTTTATVLCYEIFKGAHKAIESGARTMALREGIELTTDVVLTELDKLTQRIDIKKDIDKLLMVATVSAQNPEIGQMVADAYKELGSEGIVTVEEGKAEDSYLELKQGMQFDKGWRTPYFITSGSTLEEAVRENPYILVTDMAIRNMEKFTEFLVRLINEEKINNLVIIAERFEPQIIALFVKNHLKGALTGLMIEAPAFGEKRIDILNDIAIATGATFITESAGAGLQSVTKATLGRAKRVISSKDTTLIVDGAGTKEAIEARVKEIKGKLKNSDLSPFDREKLRERLARLHSGVGILTMGAKTEPELKERKERAIDAVSAAKAALSEGIVPGGGIALLKAAAAAEEAIKLTDKDDVDKRFGVRLVIEACRAPFQKLLTNAGYDPGEMLAKLAQEQPGAKGVLGVDVMDGQIVDMIKEGIIDPVAVVSAALGNGSSAAVSLATSDTVITEQPNNITT